MDMKFATPITNLCLISIFVSSHWPFIRGNWRPSLTNSAHLEIDFGQCGNKEKHAILVSVQPKHKLCQPYSGVGMRKRQHPGDKIEKKISQSMSAS